MGHAGLFGASRKASERRRRMRTTDKSKWEMFDRLAAHLNILADQVEFEMLKRKSDNDPGV